MPLVVLTQERMMARTVKMLFGGGADDRAAEPALTSRTGGPADRAATPVLADGTGSAADRAATPDLTGATRRAPAPINRSAADQRTPTARLVSATASGASL